MATITLMLANVEGRDVIVAGAWRFHEWRRDSSMIRLALYRL